MIAEGDKVNFKYGTKMLQGLVTGIDMTSGPVGHIMYWASIMTENPWNMHYIPLVNCTKIETIEKVIKCESSQPRPQISPAIKNWISTLPTKV